MSVRGKPLAPTCNSREDAPAPWQSLLHWERPGLTREDMGKGIATGDLQGRMLGPEDIQKECREAAQDAQEAEGGNDPQEQDCLGIHAEVCRGRTKSSGLPGTPWGRMSPPRSSPHTTVQGS